VRQDGCIGFLRHTIFAALALSCARGPEIERAESKPASAPVAAPTPEPARAPAPAPTPSLRAPDVPYDPSPEHVVNEIVRLARLRPGDVVYDLGCGDGRIVIRAVQEPGVRGVCVDIDPKRIAESRENARRAGVSDRLEFLTEDLFQTDIRRATVVTLFLWPKINLRLRPKLLSELEPGTRVISYMHDMGDWQPAETVPVHSGTRETAVYLWTIPKRDGGTDSGSSR
jgi:SAM-dependent methyltransferase